MATSRLAALAFAGLALGAAGCGGSGRSNSAAATAATAASASARTAVVTGPNREFGWLRPARAPRSWRTVTTSTGAVLAYPPGWRRVAGDSGTATAVLRDARHEYLGYLNLTPRQGEETLAGWSGFRVAHNAHEGDRVVRALAAAQHLRFRSGSGSCVRDSYATTTGARFIELACLVAGARTTSVIVAAAPPQAWTRVAPSLERAISAFTT